MAPRTVQTASLRRKRAASPTDFAGLAATEVMVGGVCVGVGVGPAPAQSSGPKDLAAIARGPLQLGMPPPEALPLQPLQPLQSPEAAPPASKKKSKTTPRAGRGAAWSIAEQEHCVSACTTASLGGFGPQLCLFVLSFALGLRLFLQPPTHCFERCCLARRPYPWLRPKKGGA